MGIVRELGISIGHNNQSDTIFESLLGDFRSVRYENPSDYVIQYWTAFKKSQGVASTFNGLVFELILATLFVRENLMPLFLQAKVAFVPNVIYDMMLYSKSSGPVCFSAKTSLRERYKQSDLEAIALKYVHRKAKSYLVTLHDQEAERVSRKITTGDVIGIDEVIIASSNRFNEILSMTKGLTLSDPGSIQIITSSNKITQQKLSSVR